MVNYIVNIWKKKKNMKMKLINLNNNIQKKYNMKNQEIKKQKMKLKKFKKNIKIVYNNYQNNINKN